MVYDPADLWDLGKLRNLYLEAENRAVEAERKYQACQERALYTEKLNEQLTSELAKK
jgi:hypothetical protein